jgi:uncharacterized protein
MGQSAVFRLFHRAILKRQQVTCRYEGHLGHKDGRERALVYQFGGTSSRGLPPEGDWRCLSLSGVLDPAPRDGQWHGDAKHSTTQKCVDVVFVDVNTDVPNQPGRRFRVVGD